MKTHFKVDNKNSSFIQDTFREYYFKNSQSISPPYRITEREFGFMSFNNIMTRHLSFINGGILRAFIIKNAPHSVYYSCAFYKDPNSTMDRKGWKGADIIFDIDADDINTTCKKFHDYWICRDCFFLNKGKKPNKCPNCSSKRVETKNWICDKCLEATKNEAIKLIDFLINDFGISKKNIEIYFSGGRGYHITIEKSNLEELNQLARNEISNYVSGIGLNLESLGINLKLPFEIIKKKLASNNKFSWKSRIFDFFSKMDYILKNSDNDIQKINTKIRYKKNIEKNIQEIINKLSVKIDSMVTIDIHRIFRLPNTLHGSTGLLKKRCQNLSSFNPLIEAVVLSEEPIKLYIKYSPKFVLKECSFGPYKSENIVLPKMAAIYLVAKGLAKLV